MATVTFLASLTGSLRRAVQKAASRLRSPLSGAPGAELIASVRRIIASEFARGGWLRPRGGFMAWPRTKPFGDKPASSPPLGGLSGSISRAWQGGAGGFARVTDGGRGIVVGVGGHPKFAVHRGGQESVRAGSFTIVRPRRGNAMRFKLGLAFNAWISKARLELGLRIPSRPHATDNPQTRKAARELLLRYVREAFA